MPEHAIRPLTEAELYRLGASAVAKVDVMGPRGTTLCSMEEIEALAMLVVMSGILPPLKERLAQADADAGKPKFSTTRKKTDDG